jgi:hypothetical protein
MLRIDEALLQLGLEAVDLLGAEVAVARGVDQRPGGTRGVVEQRLVPARGRYVVAKTSSKERPEAERDTTV